MARVFPPLLGNAQGLHLVETLTLPYNRIPGLFDKYLLLRNRIHDKIVKINQIDILSENMNQETDNILISNSHTIEEQWKAGTEPFFSKNWLLSKKAVFA